MFVRLKVVGRFATALVTAAVLAMTGGGVAQAADPPAPGADPNAPSPSTVTADALPTWQVNGVVWSQAVVGDTVYAVGSFTRARPPGVAAGGAGEVVANNIFAYSLSTGNRVSTFNHSLNAQGLVVEASPDGSRIYVGGDFTTVDGIARGHIAAFNAADGSLVNTFTPNIGGQVRALAVTPNTVYAGGNFTSANGATRTRLAAFTPSNGAMTPWAPSATGGYVWAMTLSPDKASVIVGGSFTQLSGAAAYGMGSIDAATGSVKPWKAQEKIRTAGSKGAITTLKSDGTQVYGAGYAFGAGASFEGTFAANPANGNINWVNDCLGDTYDVAPAGQVLYAASHAHDCSVVGSFPDTNPRVRWQKATAQVTYPTNMTTRNDAYGWDFRGYPYAQMLHWYPSLAFGSYTSSGQAAWNVETAGDYVVMGGEFPRVNGTSQQGLVRFKNRPTAPAKRGPTYSTTPDQGTPATTATALEGGGGVRVSFGTAWDMDNETLSYELWRDGSVRLADRVQNLKSNFWTLPRASIVDSSAPAGSHTYQVRVTDSDGNELWSPKSNAVTVGATAPSPYTDAVRADGAEHFWRLGEPSGATGRDYAGVDDVTFSGGYTRGSGGAMLNEADKASTFGGTNGLAVNSSRQPGPNVFSTELWFKTTSTTGGKILGFGDRNTGTSSNYDRHTYMDGQGRVYFGVYNNAGFTVNTGPGLNDGQWHHVVGTMDPSGPALYVDGKLVGRNSGTSVAQPYDGYWRIGGDSPWSGDAWFDGVVDDVATYPTALTLTQVQKHYRDSGRTLDVPNQAPTAAFTSTVSNLTAAFDASTSKDPDGTITSYAWDFGDQTPAGSGVKPSHTYAAAGTYQVKLTVTDDRGGTHSVTKPVTVTAPAPNQAPTAAFTSSGSNLTAAFDGSTSSDPDGSIAAYAWEFGDQTPAGSGAKPSHTYAAAGTYQVKLTVTDNQGATNSVTKPVTVTAPAPNQAPTAAFTATVSNLSAAFDASSASDPDGSIASYAWDFGDQTPAGSGAKPSHTYAAAGTYQVKLTVTDNLGATNTVTKPVTVTAPPAPTSFATDAFGRSVASGWGTADTGGAWTTTGSATKYSVAGGTGRMTLGAGVGGTAYLGGVAQKDVEVAATVSTNVAPSGGGQYLSVTGRRVSSTAEYQGALRLASGGQVTMSLLRVTSGTETTLASAAVPGLTYAANDRLRVRLQVFGTAPTTLQMKVWKDGTPEPAAWQVSTTDATAALQATGGVGFDHYVSASAASSVVVATDDLWAGPRRP